MRPPFSNRVLIATCIYGIVAAAFLEVGTADTPRPTTVLSPGARNLNLGPRMDASGRNLRDCKFVGHDLSEALFDGCDLDGCLIFDCSLTKASFRGARLTGAAIDDCRIDQADFTNAVINGIKPVEGRCSHFWLSEQQLKSTRSYRTKQLNDCRIYGIKPQYDFSDADLRGATIGISDFSDCDFDRARIQGIVLRGGIFPFPKFAATYDFVKHRRVHDAVLAVRFQGQCDFTGVDLSNSELLFTCHPGMYDFTDATITGCTLGTYFSSENMASTRSCRRGNLVRVRFDRMNLHDWDLSGMNLTYAGFGRTTMANVRLEDSVITGVRFPHPDDTGLSFEQIKSTWNYKHGRMEGIVLPENLAEALKREQAASLEE